jgi:phage/plasmid-associated DNA primase
VLRESANTYTNNPDDMTRKYIERSEPVVQFLESCCREDFDNFEKSKDVFAAYNAWAKLNKKKRMGSKEFVNAMRDQSTYSIEYHRHAVYNYRDEELYSSEKPWGFSGIRLLKDASQISGELPTA